jgi:hypothetical protein
MKKLAALLLSVFMTACATPGADPQAAEFRAWVSTTRSLAESGQMKFTDFYTQAYNRLSAMPSREPEKLAVQRAYAEMIPVARAYESGAMTREQFDDVRRLTSVALEQQSAALEAQRQQAIAEAMQRAAENMRRSQPVQTTCTRGLGSVNCVTR